MEKGTQFVNLDMKAIKESLKKTQNLVEKTNNAMLQFILKHSA